jgi:hypothetical protein
VPTTHGADEVDDVIVGVITTVTPPNKSRCMSEMECFIILSLCKNIYAIILMKKHRDNSKILITRQTYLE